MSSQLESDSFSNSIIYSFLLWNGRLVVYSARCQAASHIVPHVTCVCGLRDVLLLEALAGYLLTISLVVRAAAHAVLETFAAAHWSAGSILLHTRSACSPWPYWHSGASLARGAALHVVCSLSHSNPWARFELLNRLSVSDPNSRLILTLRLLVGASRSLLVLLLLLIHIC